MSSGNILDRRDVFGKAARDQNARGPGMSVDVLTTASDGSSRIPVDDNDWQFWVSAAQTRNFMIDDPLLDWLNLYGDAAGFPRDSDLETYDPRTDFTQFIFQKGREFEAAVISHLEQSNPIIRIAENPGDIRDLEKAIETWEAMVRGERLIWQGVLRDAELQTYGSPDLLIRSDVLEDLFPGTLSAEEIAIAADDLSEVAWHYRVVDIKYTTLRLLANGTLGNAGSAPAYKAQLFIYNRMLGGLQGFEPPESYLLGRGWAQQVMGEKLRGNSCMERLAPVPQQGQLAKKVPIESRVEDAIDWVRSVRLEGEAWEVLPEPTLMKLRPDVSNDQDAPWHAAKGQIAAELADLVLLWYVGVTRRPAAISAGVERWTDPACTPAVVGVSGPSRAPILQSMLDISRQDDGPVLMPVHVTAAEDIWRDPESLEFYVDFETTNDLNDDFEKLPNKGGQALIFMIGCGHLSPTGEWEFTCFTAERLTEEHESEIIDKWFEHMDQVKQAQSPEGPQPIVYHWSKAETVTLSTAYNAAANRHPEKKWPDLRWFDFLQEVMRSEPVVIRGVFGFGLKSVAKALHESGYIQTVWGDGPTDGLGAMVGAWWSDAQAEESGNRLIETDVMQEIIRYNEVDSRVIMEIIGHLRANH